MGAARGGQQTQPRVSQHRGTHTKEYACRARRVNRTGMAGRQGLWTPSQWAAVLNADEVDALLRIANDTARRSSSRPTGHGAPNDDAKAGDDDDRNAAAQDDAIRPVRC